MKLLALANDPTVEVSHRASVMDCSGKENQWLKGPVILVMTPVDHNLYILCDVSSEKVPEPPYVNIEKIAKARPKVKFAEFLFISLNDCLQAEEWFLRVWQKLSNVLVVFELIASLKVSIRHVFF